MSGVEDADYLRVSEGLFPEGRKTERAAEADDYQPPG